MRYKYLFLLMILWIMYGCKKEKGITNPSPPPTPPVLLKDIVIPNLPSPYYHFEYDTAGRPVFASFASDFTRYTIVYDGNKISEMRNNIIVNKDRLQYFYDNEGRVIAIKYADSTGMVYRRVIFSYEGQKLSEIERQQKSGTGFIIEKTMTMSYYPDGNLKDLTYHYLPVNGLIDQTFTDHFEQYDDKINVDGFGLLHNDFFDHLILLQGIQLQKNNPGKETRTGAAENYTATYTYTYNNKNLPLVKSGEVTVTSGIQTGHVFHTNSFYSYYQ